MKREVISSIQGRTIEEIRVMSFYINKKLVCDIIVIYIKVDTGIWYKLTTSDGSNVIEPLIDEPLEVMLDEINDDFAYPVESIKINCLNKKIERIQEYMYKNQEDELNGFYMQFIDQSGISFFEEEECLRIFDGIKTNDDYTLISGY